MSGAGRNRHGQGSAGRGQAKGRGERGRSDERGGRRERATGGGGGRAGAASGRSAGRERGAFGAVGSPGAGRGAGRGPSGERTKPAEGRGAGYRPGGGAGRDAGSVGGRGHSGGGRPAGAGRDAANSRAGAGRSSASQPAARGERLKVGRRKGEWMEFKLPDALSGAPLQKVLQHTPLAPKLAARLLQAKGAIVQGPNLRLRLFPAEDRDFPSDWMELNVLYEDDFTLVVNKPAGYEVHPSEKGQRRTLAHAVAAYYETTNQDVRIRHIHRIDKETTGPVLYAKNEFAHYEYDKEMREKKIERIYLALAEGVLPQDKGRIDKPIGQDRHHSTRRRVSETGDPAVTHYEVVERFADHTLVRLRLETGRTHQIRVHLSAIGHPLAGDGLYGGKRGLISRQALHGERLIWHHPWTGEKLSVRAPLPDDFERALAMLRG